MLFVMQKSFEDSNTKYALTTFGRTVEGAYSENIIDNTIFDVLKK